MNTSETYCFDRLKKEIASTFLKDHSAPEQIENWKGEDIVLFQEDLFQQVKAKVSEKWFYTYFKNETTKLPRIDMLNLLSNYVGSKNWHTFKNEHKNKSRTEKIGSLSKFALFIIPFIAFLVYNAINKNEFHFCFVDADKGDAITNIALDIKVLQNNQSPVYFKTDSSGCFTYKTVEKIIRLVVQSPFHRTDTIIRHIDENKNHTVQLETDDYALMLDYFANGNITDWEKRKTQLQQLFSDDAIIYQLFPNNIGVELFTKDEFIGKLIIPTSNLKRLRILDKTYKDEKIVKLKFILE